MKTPEYIILTPTAPFKLYCFERFIKNVISFKPEPKEIVFCIEPGMASEISKTNFLLDRQIGALEEKFIKNGGWNEQLYKKRKEYRGY